MSLSRQLRRAAERAQRKQERKEMKRSGTPAEAPFFSSESTLPVTEPTVRPGPTGPRTQEGKAISSLNNLKHGLSGAFRVLEFESQSDFDAAQEALIAEHNPVTPTESELIRRMAEHAWLSRRAQLLQDKALTEGDDKRLSLYMRYQTTNDRGFRACLNDLFRLRREQRTAAKQFESQKRASSAPGVFGPLCADEARSAQGACGPLCAVQKRSAQGVCGPLCAVQKSLGLANARAAHLELDADLRSKVDAPIPGYSPGPAGEIKDLFKTAMLSLKHSKGGKAAA